MNIHIERVSQSVSLLVGLGLPHEDGSDTSVISCTWSCGSAAFAYLLAGHMRREMGRTLADIRAAAYESGWRDAKAKRKRRAEFSVAWHPDFVGC